MFDAGDLVSPPHEQAAEKFWALLARRKGIVLGAVGIANVVALAMYVLAEPIYEARMGIVVGRALFDGKIRTIEAGADVLHRLENTYNFDELSEKGVRVHKPISIRSRRRDLIFVVVRAADPAVIQEVVTQPLQKLLNDHERVYSTSLEGVNQLIKTLRVEIDLLNERHNEIASRTKASEGGSGTNPAEFQKQFEAIATQKSVLQTRLEESLAWSLRHEPTRMIKNFDSTSPPIEPRLQLYVFVATLLGFLIGGFVVVLRENSHSAPSAQPRP